MVGLGPEAPDFTLPGDEGRKVCLHEELGRGPVFLSLYVFDFTVLGEVRKLAV